MNEELFKILEKNLGKDRIKVNEPMSEYTSFKIGGPADFLYVADQKEDIIKAVRVAHEANLDYFILGNGSNLLVSDKGIRGMVVKIENVKLVVGAGVLLAEVVRQAVDAGLTGLEFAIGIPGSFGGAVAGNAGAWQQAIGDKITRVHVLSAEVEDKWVDKSECGFDYRQSRFKMCGEIILEAELELEIGEVREIREKMKDYFEKRSAQPKEPSAGSVFINPKPQAAGTLIDSCGLKGYRIGGAQISPLHANFIVNTGNATCQDVLELIAIAKEKVREKYGIVLIEEVKIIGEY